MKINRAAFLYLDPVRPLGSFAQCSTCRDWVTGDRRCFIHGRKVTVPGTASCGFYVHGPVRPAGTSVYAWVTPEESGLVNRQVRCENCKYMDGATHCGFFAKLNNELPEVFDLDETIDAHGCCNAQTPEM
jgi:hypothetical protein